LKEILASQTQQQQPQSAHEEAEEIANAEKQKLQDENIKQKSLISKLQKQVETLEKQIEEKDEEIQRDR
jgi:hypothetical protein